MTSDSPQGHSQASGPELTGASGWVPGLLAGVAVLVRVMIAVTHPEPIGIDVANWVRVWASWWGEVDLEGAMVPPLVPAITGIASELFGVLWAARLAPAVAAAAAGLGVWWTVRTWAPPWVAIVAQLAVTTAASTAAAAWWGGVPQLLGFAVAVPATLYAARWATAPTARYAGAVTVALVVVAATSTLALALTIVSSVIAIGLVSLRQRSLGWVRTLWIPAAGAAVCAVWYTPYLARLDLPVGRMTSSVSLSDTATMFGLPIWAVAATVFVAATGVWAARDDIIPYATMSALSLGGLLSGFIADDIRFTYLAPTALVMAATGWWVNPSGPRPLRRSPENRGQFVRAAVATAVPVGLISFGGLSNERSHVAFYASFNPPGTLAAAQHVAARTRSSGTVAVAAVNGAPAGWWVEAFGVDAAVGSRPDWLFFPAERSSAAVVTDVFSASNWPQVDALAMSEPAGYRWLYAPPGWGGLDYEALGQLTERCPGALVSGHSGSVLLRADTGLCSGEPPP